tara:strand:+ start:6046 stop:6273 length:228 start_codon:yes stop_codon:yes gene_type:complete
VFWPNLEKAFEVRTDGVEMAIIHKGTEPHRDTSQEKPVQLQQLSESGALHVTPKEAEANSVMPSSCLVVVQSVDK